MKRDDERIGDDLILERMYAGEQVLLSQADALDMKASYLLIVLIFLAQLSTTFLTAHDLTCIGKTDQWLSCFFLLISGIFLLLELRIKSFKGEHAQELEAWRDRVVGTAQESQEYKDTLCPDNYLRSKLVWGMMLGSKNRIVESEKHNEKKVRCLKWAYGLTFAAFLLDIMFMLTYLHLRIY